MEYYITPEGKDFYESYIKRHGASAVPWKILREMGRNLDKKYWSSYDFERLLNGINRYEIDNALNYLWRIEFISDKND